MAWGEHPEELDPDAVRRAVDLMTPLFRANGPYPCEVTGLDHLPDEPVLVVSNHSGGLFILDAWGLGYIWCTQVPERAVHSLAHEILFKLERTGAPLGRIGVLKAGPKVGIEVLRDWRRDVVVMPGGDRDVFRPYKDRFKVQFGGRKGYAKMALRAGVPIVPVANSGAHETLVVLRSGRRIAKALGLHALARADVFPISLTVPWGLTVGPLPNLPVPARFRYRFAAPIRLEPDPVAEPTRAQIEELDRRVRGSMQELLDQLREETPSIAHRLRHGLRS